VTTRRLRLRSLTLAAVAAVVAPVTVAGLATGADATPRASALPAAPAAAPAGATIKAAAAKTFTIPYAGLTSTPVLSGLSSPTAFRFAPGGKIFVADKAGVVRTFDGPGDTTPTTALDIRDDVYDQGARGLLGLAVDPGFADDKPFLYVLFSYDRDPFGTAEVPRWGTADGNDACADPPGAETDGCTSSARLVRYRVEGGVADPASRTMLLDGAETASGGWCQQFPADGVGTVEFGPDGNLYVGAGDGASSTAVDFGQLGGSAGSPTPANPCADAPEPRGTALTPTTSQGGALRAQAVRGAAADGYVSWDGAILRVDPQTGAAAAGNPLLDNGIAGDDRIVAYGLRNPYRFAFRTNTSELWLGDQGFGSAEEIDTFVTGTAQTTVPNFGWPCYEGAEKQAGYDTADVNLCEGLYATPESQLGGVASPLVAPYHSYAHTGAQPANGCANTTGGSVVGGRYVTNTKWPSELVGAYVVADPAHGCIAAFARLANGKPDVTKRAALVTNTAVTDLQIGPGGDVYWIDGPDGSLNRLRSSRTNVPPVARFTATPGSGPAPLTVHFDASTTTDANEGEILSYKWELSGNNRCDDATGPEADYTYPKRGKVTVKLCVSDQLGSTGVATAVIEAGNAMPVITSLTSSADEAGWAVGDTIRLDAEATDDLDTLVDSQFTWSATALLCPGPDDTDTCEAVPFQALPAGRSTSFVAPDAPYYVFFRVELTVTDSEGGVSTRTIELKPRTSRVTLATEPAGIPVSLGTAAGDSPLAGDFLESGLSELLVPATAVLDGKMYRFTGWSDGELGLARQAAAPAGGGTFTAVYEEVPNALPTVSGAGASPASIATGPGTVTVSVTATISDDSAVASAEARLLLPDGTELFGTMSLASGSPSKGLWTATVGVPYGSPGGTYGTQVVASDDEGALGIGSGPSINVRARTCVMWWCW
jgi:glucose/arabinose dehydrogenase